MNTLDIRKLVENLSADFFLAHLVVGERAQRRVIGVEITVSVVIHHGHGVPLDVRLGRGNQILDRLDGLGRDLAISLGLEINENRGTVGRLGTRQ